MTDVAYQVLMYVMAQSTASVERMNVTAVSWTVLYCCLHLAYFSSNSNTQLIFWLFQIKPDGLTLVPHKIGSPQPIRKRKRKELKIEQEIRSVELGVCPMQRFHFWSRDHIQFKICCCLQNVIEIGWFFCWLGDITIFKWRPSAISELFYHHRRPSTKSLLLAVAACQISYQCETQIWRYSYLNFSHIWLEMPI